MGAADILDRDGEYNDYQLIGKPTTEKYKIDGEKAGTYSYKELSDTSDFILNVEDIILLHDDKYFLFQFSYAENKIDGVYITQIKKHMFNSIEWIRNENFNKDYNQ